MSIPTLGRPVPRKDITIKQNADFTYALCIIERDENSVATVVDTTGWEVKMQVRRAPDPASPVICEASTANGYITVGINGVPGEEVNIDIRIPETITAALSEEGQAGYDIRVLYPDGNAEYLVEGRAYIQPAYTW